MAFRFSLKFAVLAAALCAIFPAPLAFGDTLGMAVRTALETHPSVDAAEFAKAGAKQSVREEFSALFPEINASATGGRIFGNNSSSRGLDVTRGEAYSYLWEGSASITQKIFDGMEAFNRIDAAEAREGSADYEIVDAREYIALQAVQAYLRILQAREARGEVKAYLKTLGDYQGRIRRMVDEGAADESEASQAKNIMKLLESRLSEYDAEVERAAADYRQAVGAAPADTLEKPRPPDDMTYANVEEAVAYAMEHHPTVMQAKMDFQAAAFDAEAEKGTLFPDLDGELSTLKRDQIEELGGEVLDQRAVLRMSWNFSMGGAQIARIRKAKAAYSEALAKAQQTQRDVERNVRQAYAQMNAAQKQRTILAEREKITQDLFATYKAQFEGSKVRLLQLMQAENQTFTTRLEKINADYSDLAAHYAMLAGMGKLINALGVGDTEQVYPATAANTEDTYPPPGSDARPLSSVIPVDLPYAPEAPTPEPAVVETAPPPLKQAEKRGPQAKENIYEAIYEPASQPLKAPPPAPEAMPEPEPIPVAAPVPVKPQDAPRFVYPAEDYLSRSVKKPANSIYPDEDYSGPVR